MGAHLDRARLLYDQDRYDLAEKELLAALGEDPDDASCHALLAFCRIRTDRRDAALASAREAVRLSPDWGYCHFALGKVHYMRDEHAKAGPALREAIRLNPEEPNYRCVLAGLLLDTGKPEEALEAVDAGLAIDPELSALHSMRGLILYHSDRVAEAETAFRRALSLDPGNDVAHAGLGRVEASRGRADAAVERYRDALRLDPNDATARDGLLEAMKARYPVYGLFLRYLEWTRRLPARTRTFLFIGIYVLFRVAGNYAKTAEGPAKWALLAFALLYILLVFLTWVADPLFNLLLRMKPEGRLLLTRDEVAASNLVGASLGAAVLCAGAAALTQSIPLAVAAVLFVLSVPALVMIHGIQRPALRAVAGTAFLLVLLLGLGGIALMAAGKATGPGLALVVVAGFLLVLSTWATVVAGLFRRG